MRLARPDRGKRGARRMAVVWVTRLLLTARRARRLVASVGGPAFRWPVGLMLARLL